MLLPPREHLQEVASLAGCSGADAASCLLLGAKHPDDTSEHGGYNCPPALVPSPALCFLIELHERVGHGPARCKCCHARVDARLQELLDLDNKHQGDSAACRAVLKHTEGGAAQRFEWRSLAAQQESTLPPMEEFRHAMPGPHWLAAQAQVQPVSDAQLAKYTFYGYVAGRAVPTKNGVSVLLVHHPSCETVFLDFPKTLEQEVANSKDYGEVVRGLVCCGRAALLALRTCTWHCACCRCRVNDARNARPPAFIMASAQQRTRR